MIGFYSAGAMGSGAAPSPPGLFKVVLYTGDGSSARMIDAGIDMSGGGIVEIRPRTANDGAYIFSDGLVSPLVVPLSATTAASSAAASLTSSGVDLTDATYNVNGRPYVAFFYKKAARFLDVVPYTGNGTNRTIAHALGVAPGFLMVRRANGTGSMQAYHVALGANTRRVMTGNPGSSNDLSAWANTAPTSTVFSLGASTLTNQNSAAMWAFLWADDTESGGAVRAFSYTGNGTTPGPAVSLGWQPEYVMCGRNGTTFAYQMDQVRSPGFSGNDAFLQFGSANAEGSTDVIVALETGGVSFPGSTALNGLGVQHYGIAIRAP